MEQRIFLGKYRVATTKSAQWWEACRSHFDVTCQAEEIETGRKVVIELVPAFLLGETYREALKTTAARARLIRHVNIPTLHDFGEEGEQLVYVTEHVHGRTAKSWVAARGPTPIATALGIALQVVSALGVALQRQVHFPAINPDNLMIVPGHAAEGGWPLVKVLHFLGPPPTLRSFNVSNPMGVDAAAPFASPEQNAGATVDFQSAIYSLGATVWFLLSAPASGAASGRAEKKSRLDPARAFGQFEGLPERVAHLLARMSAENRNERPLDPIALEKEIRGCLSELDPAEVIKPAVPVAPVPQVPRAERSIWRSLGLKLLVVAGLVAILVLIFRGVTENAPVTGSADVPGLRPARERPIDAAAAIRNEAALENRSATGAMNFAVSPSYEEESGQIQALGRFPGTRSARDRWLPVEPAPPGEGPEAPEANKAGEDHPAQAPAAVQANSTVPDRNRPPRTD